MSTTTNSRPATIGLVGGALWALLPVAWSVASLEDAEFGTLQFVAVAASYWIFLTLAPLLVIAGIVALQRTLGPDVGRVARAGFVVAAAGMGAMGVGNGIEVASMSAGGGEVSLGHTVFLIGFLVSVVGGIVLGVTVIRRRSDVLSRVAGWLLTLALPVGIGIGVLGSAIDPNNDAWFWAAIAVPTGIAWALLCRSLRTSQAAAREFATAV